MSNGHGDFSILGETRISASVVRCNKVVTCFLRGFVEKSKESLAYLKI